MPLDKDIKAEIIAQHARSEGDTGSPEVQVAILTRRIADLTEHLKVHKHDHSTRRGLKILAGQRTRLLRYLRGQEQERYRNIIQVLGLRR